MSVRHGSVLKGSNDAEIGVMEVGVFAHQDDSDSLVQVLLRAGEGLPCVPNVCTFGQQRRRNVVLVEAEDISEKGDEALAF